jgi:hypothetical protein
MAPETRSRWKNTEDLLPASIALESEYQLALQHGPLQQSAGVLASEKRM